MLGGLRHLGLLVDKVRKSGIIDGGKDDEQLENMVIVSGIFIAFTIFSALFSLQQLAVMFLVIGAVHTLNQIGACLAYTEKGGYLSNDDVKLPLCICSVVYVAMTIFTICVYFN
ncbi:hypothetical protein [Pseudoalteromonas phage J2-1_QLiu-2017]|nr:hypothetical protein [Pseudoalteromonas phage J2-1_QLiu-2017]